MTGTLTSDQGVALESIEDWFRDQAPEASGSPKTAYLLEGGAGTGKTYLLGQILEQLAGHGYMCVAAPTHKACNVLRRKLEAFGVRWVRNFDPYRDNESAVITGTTAQLLGIGPVISDDQDHKNQAFKRRGGGLLSKVTPALLVIDEVSMLGLGDFAGLVKLGHKSGMKILAVGDSGQLPPVKQEQIPFGRFKRQSLLRQVVRQAEGSAILTLAWAVRDGKPWRDVAGTGVQKVSSTRDLVDAYLSSTTLPAERAEEDREVYVAYRNAVVDTVQERACQKLYKHGKNAFAPGELVLSETNLYRGEGLSKTLVCANQDELLVTEFREDLRDPTIGVPVVLRQRGRQSEFEANYLTPEELANKNHPYNQELSRLLSAAQTLQGKYKSAKRGEATDLINSQRKKAWRDYFDWRDQTVISFRHPFAITSHKSQGSTYRAVYADVNDLARCSTHALYVAVTRPRELLVVQG